MKDFLRQVKPLYIASFLMGCTAILIVSNRARNVAPTTKAFDQRVIQEGYQNNEEYLEYLRISEDYKKEDYSQAEKQFLSRLLARGNDASYSVAASLAMLKKNEDRKFFLKDLEKLATLRPTDGELQFAIKTWFLRGESGLVVELSKQSNALGTIAKTVIKENEK
jgi:hypothetical protein